MDIIEYWAIFVDSQVKLFKKDIDLLIDHMSNDIVNKEQSAVDEFRKNINNSVSYLHIRKKNKNDNVIKEYIYSTNFSILVHTLSTMVGYRKKMFI